MTVYNHLLFSEIFFQQIRRETADLENLRATLSTIRDTWQYYLPPPPSWDGRPWTPAVLIHPDDVTQLRSQVVEQILAYLETTYGPCEADSRAFFLYGDWAKEDRTGLCLVLPYSSHIEGRDAATGIIPKGRNYAQQLLRLLRQHDLDWGVLTNGRQWRLFHRQELSPTDTFVHVDLEQIILTDDIQNYIVFHRFFNRAAFARDGGRQHLDQYKQQSDKATEIIEDHLSAHVEEIARQLCQGLVESCREESEDVTSPETRKEIYKNALFLVYRLLFVLYAEARRLLPLDNDAYREVCLEELLLSVRQNHQQGLRYADAYAIWTRLQALFALIDQGKPTAGVPAYNGGLFDPGRRPFLTRHRIRNDYLQTALIRLSTIPARGKTYDQDREPRPIDYRDLSVRHLGSLYEGLLEYNLFVVEDEPRVVRTSQKKTQYVPYSQAGKVRAGETVLQVGDVYFSETAGERKATGSYYTPEDVVDYIVRNTVGEKLAELQTEFYAQQQIERQLADLVDTPPDIPAHRQIQQTLDDQFLTFVRDKVLHLKILDPAMGSGHFLVNATHALANSVVEVLNATLWENAEIDTDVATWKRCVAERCIFGVDLNELAVELAKLCLWMTTTAKGKPLTFLDHHLRWGNSLVGVRVGDAGIYPLTKKESRQAFTLPLERFRLQLGQVLVGYEELYARSSDNVDEVREKARIFEEEIYPKLQRYRELLDLHTGVLFGRSVDESAYAELGTAVLDESSWSALKTRNLARVLEGCRSNHWLHWELEFPEVFCGQVTGFDIVLGNPPYVDVVVDAYVNYYYECATTRNLYALFLEKSTTLVGAGGHTGMIVPLSLVCSARMGRLREWLKSSCADIRLANFGIRPSKIFAEVDQRVTIVITRRKESPGQSTTIMSTRFLHWHNEQRARLLSNLCFADISDLPDHLGWAKLGEELGRSILQKIYQSPQTIGERLGPGWKFYYHGIGRYWLKAYDFAPVYLSAEGEPLQSSTLFEMSAQSQSVGRVILAILNSSLFFWYWVLYGDDFHVMRQEIACFPFCPDESLHNLRADLEKAVDALMRDYREKSVLRQVKSPRGVITLQEFYPRRSRTIIERIDDLLGAAYGLTSAEIEYIKNYDLAFRTDED